MKTTSTILFVIACLALAVWETFILGKSSEAQQEDI